jgi:hypothetical protein
MTRWEQIKKGFETFLSTGEEWHAFAIGFCEILCPWPPRRHIITQQEVNSLKGEHHYYLFGRAMGIIAWILLAKLIQVWFW